MKTFKQIVLLIIALASIFTSLNAQKKATLFIDIRDAIDSTNYNQKAIFTLKNSKGLNSTYFLFYSGYLIDNPLDTGRYTIINSHDSASFDTINFNIDLPKIKRIQLRNTYSNFKSPTIQLIDSLKIGEHFNLFYQTSGCFHYGFDSLMLSRDTNNYNLTYRGATSTLNESKLKAFYTFFNQLSSIRFGGCTTRTTYHFKYKNTNYYIGDNDCGTDPYYNLIKALFGENIYNTIITHE